MAGPVDTTVPVSPASTGGPSIRTAEVTDIHGNQTEQQVTTLATSGGNEVDGGPLSERTGLEILSELRRIRRAVVVLAQAEERDFHDEGDEQEG